jgi:hypothetical protein
MNKTLAEIISEVETTVRPLGFEIQAVKRFEYKALFPDDKVDNEIEISIVIVHKGKFD